MRRHEQFRRRPAGEGFVPRPGTAAALVAVVILGLGAGGRVVPRRDVEVSVFSVLAKVASEHAGVIALGRPEAAGLMDVWREVREERAGIEELLAGLAPAEWDTASLCAGWRVREVVGHLTLAPTWEWRSLALGMMEARLNFNTMVDRHAARLGGLPQAELRRRFHETLGSRRHPPGTRSVDVLIDVMVHHQDMARPLGIEVRPPPGRAAAAANRLLGLGGILFRTRRRFAGVRLVATDASWSHGDGPELRGPMISLVMALAGRPSALADLEGEGVAVVAART